MKADLFARDEPQAVITKHRNVGFTQLVVDAETFRRLLAEKRCEVCGGPGLFGFQSSARQGRLGLWYCGRHVDEGRRNG